PCPLFRARSLILTMPRSLTAAPGQQTSGEVRRPLSAGRAVSSSAAQGVGARSPRLCRAKRPAAVPPKGTAVLAAEAGTDGVRGAPRTGEMQGPLRGYAGGPGPSVPSLCSARISETWSIDGAAGRRRRRAMVGGRGRGLGGYRF